MPEYDGITLDFNLSTVENANGLVNITVTFEDGEDTSTRVFDVNVSAINDAVIINSSVSDMIVYKNFNDINIDLDIVDAEGDILSYTLVYNENLLQAVLENDILILIGEHNVTASSDLNGSVIELTPKGAHTTYSDTNLTRSKHNNHRSSNT